MDSFLQAASLSPYRRSIKKGEALFRQGESGRTLFMIVEGKVQLLSENEEGSFPIAVIPTGEFLGEKALVRDLPHQRAFTALALTDVTVVEIGPRELKEIQTKSPEVVSDILRRSFEVAAGRLDRANYLLGALREIEPQKRAVRCLIYVIRNLAEGNVLRNLEETLQYHLGQPQGQAKLLITELVKVHALRPIGAVDYQLVDESKVLGLLN